jgi:urease accessory protein
MATATPQLDLSFTRGPDGATFLDRRIFRWPFTVTRTFHIDTDPAELLTLIVQTASGAILATDSLTQRFRVGPGAAAQVRTQGATPVYRAPAGVEATERIRLTIEEDGFFEYLPDPKILFADASVSQHLCVQLAPGAVAVVSEAFVRRGLAEADDFHHFAAEMLIETRDRQVVVFDRRDLAGLPRYGGQRARYVAHGTLTVATFSKVAIDRLSERIEARTSSIKGLYSAISPMPNDSGVSLRVAAVDGRCLREGLQAGWSASREHLIDLLPTLRGPRSTLLVIDDQPPASNPK